MSHPSTYQRLDVSVQEGIALVKMDRPDDLNAVDAVMHSELATVWVDLDSNDDVEVIVLTGAGKAFSVGGDLDWVRGVHASFAAQRGLMRDGLRLLDNFLSVEKPIIAAVNGHAIGLGATLAVLADMTIISAAARLGDTHVKAGVVAGDGGAMIWPMIIGVKRAKQFLMTGELIGAVEAERLGLVNKVVARDEVLPTAMALADELRGGATWAIRWTKSSIQQWLRLGRLLTMPSSLALEMLSFNGEDPIEGIDAFVEGRAPRFRG